MDDIRKPRKSLPPVEEALDRLAFERYQESNADNIDVHRMHEKDQYTYYYDRIYPLVNENRIDYGQIALKTEFKERRIRETLLFRLTAGEVMQLFGRKDGYCYICKKRLTSLKSTEPLCLKCLQVIDTAIQESQLPSLLSIDPDPPYTLPQSKPAESPLIPSVTPVDGPLSEEGAISREQYNALLAELNYYKAQAQPQAEIIPLHSKQPAQTAQGNAGAAGDNPSPAAEKSPLAIAASDVLAILDMEEEDLSTENYWEPDSTGNGQSQPLRQFGFQRLKSPGQAERSGKWS